MPCRRLFMLIYFLLVLIVIETKQRFCGELTLKQRRPNGTSFDSENTSELSGVPARVARQFHITPSFDGHACLSSDDIHGAFPVAYRRAKFLGVEEWP